MEGVFLIGRLNAFSVSVAFDGLHPLLLTNRKDGAGRNRCDMAGEHVGAWLHRLELSLPISFPLLTKSRACPLPIMSCKVQFHASHSTNLASPGDAIVWEL